MEIKSLRLVAVPPYARSFELIKVRTAPVHTKVRAAPANGNRKSRKAFIQGMEQEIPLAGAGGNIKMGVSSIYGGISYF